MYRQYDTPPRYTLTAYNSTLAKEKRSVIQIPFVVGLYQSGVVFWTDSISPVGFSRLKFENGYSVSHTRPVVEFSVGQGGQLSGLRPLRQTHFALALATEFVPEKRAAIINKYVDLFRFSYTNEIDFGKTHRRTTTLVTNNRAPTCLINRCVCRHRGRLHCCPPALTTGRPTWTPRTRPWPCSVAWTTCSGVSRPSPRWRSATGRRSARSPGASGGRRPQTPRS